MGYSISYMDLKRVYGINGNACDVLTAIHEYMRASELNGKKDSNGRVYVYASQDTIAARTGKSLRSISRAISALKQAGIIELTRTRGNACMYFTEEYTRTRAASGVSRYVKSGVSNINNASLNNTYANSKKAMSKQNTILQSRTDRRASAAAEKTKTARTAAASPAHTPQPIGSGTGTAAAMPVLEKRGYTPRKGRATAKRNNSAMIARRQRAQEMREHLARNMGLYSPVWDFVENENDRETLRQLAEITANAAAGERVQACGQIMTGGEYWQTVSRINDRGTEDLAQRIREQYAAGNIRNFAAYALTCMYKLSQEQAAAAAY